jgi:phosphoribosylanthranilate isomerase
MFVKICGIARWDDAVDVAEAGPDAMGFVFWPQSARYVRPADAAAWVADLPPAIFKVGVFVDAAPEEVRRIVETVRLDVAQLHGSESPAAYLHLGAKLWKALRAGRDRAEKAAAWSVDALLLDTYSDDAPGGTGKLGDWEAAREFVRAAHTKVLLAGGLRPESVADAIREVRPWGVDVSSGVEAGPGRKDPVRVKEFIEQCRTS